MVTVRLFAALREAAGTATVRVPPAPLPELLADLCARFGEPFRARLRAAAVLVDGDPVDPGAAVDVADGAEIALLPPFSGGAPCAGGAVSRG